MIFTFDLLVSNPEAALRIFKANVNSAFVPHSLSLGIAAIQSNDLITAREHFAKASSEGHPSGNFWLAMIENNPEAKLKLLLEFHQTDANCAALMAAIHASRATPNTSLVRMMLARSIDAGSLIGLYNATTLVNVKTRIIVARYIAEHAADALNFHDFVLVKSYLIYSLYYYHMTTFGFESKHLNEFPYACHGLFRFFAKVYRRIGNPMRERDALRKAWLFDGCKKSMLDYVGDNVAELRKLGTPDADQIATTIENYPVGFVSYANRKFTIVLAGDIPMCRLGEFNVNHVEARAIPYPSVDYAWSCDSITSIEIVKRDEFFNETLLSLNNLKRVRLKKLVLTIDALNLAFALLSCGVKRVELDRCHTCPMEPSGNTIDTFKKQCVQFFFACDVTTEECRAHLIRQFFPRAAELSLLGRQHVARATKRKMIGSIKTWK